MSQEILRPLQVDKPNLILVGMPGSGKSTLGVLLAKQLVKKFCDTDIIIQEMTGEPLQTTIDRDGYLHLREIEEEACLSVNFDDTVIATGGSAVYGAKGMEHLRSQGWVIYLQVSIDELLRRIPDMETRGIAMKPGQTFRSLYLERCTLYEKFADMTLSCDGLSIQETIPLITQQLSE